MASKEPGFFSSTTRSLARKLNSQVSRVRDPSHAFPVDVLSASEVQPQFLQHIGFPESADSVAYEPVQKLLAVCTLLLAVFASRQVVLLWKQPELPISIGFHVPTAGRHLRWSRQDHRACRSRGHLVG